MYTKTQPNFTLVGNLLFCICITVVSASYGQQTKLDEVRELINTQKSRPFTSVSLPVTPNPFVSLLPPKTQLDYDTWRNYLKNKNQEAARQQLSKGSATSINERERVPGSNDTQSRAEKINNFEARSGNHGGSSRIFIYGTSGEEVTFSEGASVEDDGSIPLANPGVDALFEGITVSAFIGDGPSPGVLSDFDFYEVTATAGASILIDINTPEPFGDLDPFVSVFDAEGTLLDYNDDDGSSWDSFLSFSVPVSGTYYVCVGGFGAFFPIDPFDSQSGSIGELGSEGDYELLLSVIEFEVDFYGIELKKGDVFGAAIISEGGFSPRLTINNPNGGLRVTTNLFTTFYPPENPLPVDGQTTISFIAPQKGIYAISVSENLGDYRLELFVTRPGNEVNPGQKQVIYLDYNGSDFDPCEFLELDCTQPTYLSPLRDFLPAFGLPNNKKTVKRITSRITQVVQENLEKDLKESGLNNKFAVEIRSNDGLPEKKNKNKAERGKGKKPKGGNPVSRVIVGGTIDEAFISTIGIAQSIDLGNFRTEEDAIVLLDILSAPASGSSADFTFSLNDVILAPGVTKEDLVVTALGNIASHEAGHYLGNWHNDGLSNKQVIMDEGPGGLFNLIGVGRSGIFGASDKTDVDLKTDDYSAFELFAGVENTKANTAFGLSFVSSKNNYRVIALEEDLQEETELSQTYPNPANINAVLPVSFRIPVDGYVKVQIFNLTGAEVGTMYEGQVEKDIEYQLSLNTKQYRLEKGIYIYKLTSPVGVMSKKFVLLDE